MKITIKILSGICIGIFCVILLVIAGLYASGNGYVMKAFRTTILKGYSTTYIDDYVDFNNSVIRAGMPQPWELHENYNQIRLTDTLRKELEDFHSIAFALVKDGKLLYEEYWDGYSDSSLTNSFSMAKTMTTMLLGKAIEQSYVKSVDQPLADFLPEFLDDSFGKLATVGDLATMRSGFSWEEDYYTPINMTTEAYFGENVEKQLLKRHFESHPGGKFKYLSANTQLLAMALKRATGKSPALYFSEEFWQPMGMEHDALWSLSGDIEKSFCCVYSGVRDFARLGLLMLQKGNWKGRQILDSAFVEWMITPDTAAFEPDEPVMYAGSVWIDDTHNPPFYGMMGHLGQRIIVVPDENLVIVRLGKEKDSVNPRRGHLDTDVYYFVEESLKIINGQTP
ncbi:MAG: beta-lactamase family protein [Dysgonamonadaceae bacterium]|jgi:CubicO group peptidase (beta-lactamase class C family)|nr:beta-lactamase family protein [Dysgonamonadaceae bacterium]